MTSCCCFSMGQAEMQVALPGQDWARGEGVEILVDANNPSTARFKSMQVRRQLCAPEFSVASPEFVCIGSAPAAAEGQANRVDGGQRLWVPPLEGGPRHRGRGCGRGPSAPLDPQ